MDFSKTFASIPRGLLFQKLLACGINGKVFNLLKNRYSKEKCKIGLHINKGVRQGCILSLLILTYFWLI